MDGTQVGLFTMGCNNINDRNTKLDNMFISPEI